MTMLPILMSRSHLICLVEPSSIFLEIKWKHEFYSAVRIYPAIPQDIMELSLSLIFNIFLLGFGGGLELSKSPSPDLHRDCGSPRAEIVHVEFIPPCEKDACILRRGEGITVIANFKPKINSKIITANAYQTESFFQVETILVQGENLCGKHNISCPLVADQMQYAVVKGTVPQTFPVAKTTFKIVFFADNQQRILCGSCPIEVR